MTWRMRVRHTTRYAYAGPVASSFNEARLTPVSDVRQTVVSTQVQTVPATRAFRYTDYWGTLVTAFDLQAVHHELEVIGESVVETAAAPSAVPPELAWAEVRAPAIVDAMEELLEPTEYVPRDDALAEVALALADGRSPREAALAVFTWVHEHMAYVPGSTAVHTSATQAFAERSGVCQDFAHLSLLLLRAVGIPARYVSGYLHPSAEPVIGETVQGESHAWVQAFTGHWWGYDPTNLSEIGPEYIAVGVGRDYADAPPLKGIFTGGAASDLEVTVAVTRLA